MKAKRKIINAVAQISKGKRYYAKRSQSSGDCRISCEVQNDDCGIHDPDISDLESLFGMSFDDLPDGTEVKLCIEGQGLVSGEYFLGGLSLEHDNSLSVLRAIKQDATVKVKVSYMITSQPLLHQNNF